MNKHSSLKLCIYPILIISALYFLASCGSISATPPLNTTTATRNVITATSRSIATPSILKVTPTSTTASTRQITISHTPLPATEHPTALSTTTTTTTTTTLATTKNSPIPTSQPFPTLIPCDNQDKLPEKSFPIEIDIQSSQVFVAEPYMYLAVEQYIGIFDISDPVYPQFLGFWEFPDWSDISDIQVHNNVVYVVSDSTLHMLSLNPQCQFSSISNVEMPFQILHTEFEQDRIYTGGYLENQKTVQIIVLSNKSYPPVELGVISLEPAIWSVSQQHIYSLSSDTVSVTDVSTLQQAETQLVNFVPDEEVLSRSWGTLIKDAIYLFSEQDGVLIVKNLANESPVIHHDKRQYIGIDEFQIYEDYIILGSNFCDVECGSVAYILDADTGVKLSSFNLLPYYPVYNFLEIRNDIIYALSDNSLLVIDISDISNPQIIGKIPLTI